MEGRDQCNILMISGGLIGYIPYYLTRRTDYDSKNRNITVIELHRIGVLAIRAYPVNIVPRSFKLHQDLSIDHGAREQGGLAERPRTTVWLRERLRGNSKARRGESHGQGLPRDLGWVTPHVADSYEDIGSSKQGSQVDPYQFTLSMVRPASERGAKTTIGTTTTPSSPVSGYAIVSEITIPPTPPPSLEKNQPSSTFSPEIYAPWNSEIPVCGEAEIEKTEDVNIAETRCYDLIAQVSCISDHIGPGHRTRKQACYLPVLNFGGSGGDQICETGTEG
ncbi:hypothetical protein HOY80DRAFT_1014660 [Tuber brumale]|nr:hypothetical protein HOY80DRAFT_1014660 [Tuber brumale]